MTQTFRYRAFISYRHADNKEVGRQWATWLHQAIETYEVPDDLVGTKNQRGEEIPARIFPIFRDEQELPAHADLGTAITHALDNTETLIVLCSPNAVQSTYVADEISYFKQLGRSNRIIAAITAGEPNTSWDASKQASGFSVHDECFPTPLQFEYDEHGRTDKRAEPIAADFRVNEEGKPYEGWTSPEAYRAWLVGRDEDSTIISNKVEAYTAQLNLMRLKIIAGILGIPLGYLTKRDQAYQLAQERERAKKLRRWLLVVGALAVIAISTSIWAWVQRQVALENEQMAVERLQERQIADASRLTNEAIEYLDDGNVTEALNRLNDAIPASIDNPEWPIGETTIAVLNRAVSMEKGGAIIKTDISEFATLHVIDDKHLLAIDRDNRAFLYTKLGDLVREWQFDSQMRLHLTDDKQRLVGAAFVGRTEPAPENSPNDEAWVEHYIAKTVNIPSGEVVTNIDIKVQQESISFQNGFSFSDDNQLFSPDGSQYLAYQEDYSGSHSVYSLIVTNTATGDIKYQATLTARPENLLALDNNRFVVLESRSADEYHSYLQQISYHSTDSDISNVLWQSGHMLACIDGELVPVEKDTQDTLSISISRQRNAVVAMWNKNYRRSEFCLQRWALDEGVSSPIITVGSSESKSLTDEARTTLETALDTSPKLVFRDRYGDFTIPDYGPKDYFNVGTKRFYADATRVITENQSLDLPDEAGKIEQVVFDEPSGLLWYASVDRSIRSFAYRGSEQRFSMTLPLFDSQLSVQQDSILVVNKRPEERGDGSWLSTWWYMDKLNEALPIKHTAVVPQQYPIYHLYPNNILSAVTFDPDAQDLDIWGNRVTDVTIYDAQSGKEKLTFNYLERFVEPLPHNDKVLAYLSQGKLCILDLKTLQTQSFQFPEHQTPVEVMVFDDQIVAITFDDNMDNPDLRTVSMYRVNDNDTGLEKFAEKQAQGVEVTTMPHGQSALLEWNIRYDKPKEYQVIFNDLSLHSVVQGWEDSFGLRFILPINGDRIIAITDNKYAQEFDYAGNLLSETITQSDWFEGFLSSDAKYLLAKDKVLPLNGTGACELPSINPLASLHVQISSQAKFLAYSDEEATKVFDLTSCAISYELPISGKTSENLVIEDDGTLYLLSGVELQIHKTVNSLRENVSALGS